tara:strand:+ start:522 stop:686 length:165 start_codon:yes stop_codon:yes gene_type:complete
MKTKLKKQSKLEDMTDDELLKLQDGFLQLRSHATRGLENIAKIQQSRLEKRFHS